MREKTRKALEGSIRKWRRIVQGTGNDAGTENCPLCELFYWQDKPCVGCPVAKKVGQSECSGSPYEEWARLDLDLDNSDGYARTEEQKRLAQAELDFLISLRPTRRKHGRGSKATA